jgi:hypothetical protein
VENGWASGQSREKNATGNWTIRLSKLPQIVPRSAEQKEDLDTPNWRLSDHLTPFLSFFESDKF